MTDRWLAGAMSESSVRVGHAHRPAAFRGYRYTVHLRLAPTRTPHPSGAFWPIVGVRDRRSRRPSAEIASGALMQRLGMTRIRGCRGRSTCSPSTRRAVFCWAEPRPVEARGGNPVGHWTCLRHTTRGRRGTPRSPATPTNPVSSLFRCRRAAQSPGLAPGCIPRGR